MLSDQAITAAMKRCDNFLRDLTKRDINFAHTRTHAQILDESGEVIAERLLPAEEGIDGLRALGRVMLALKQDVAGVSRSGPPERGKGTRKEAVIAEVKRAAMDVFVIGFVCFAGWYFVVHVLGG